MKSLNLPEILLVTTLYAFAVFGVNHTITLKKALAKSKEKYYDTLVELNQSYYTIASNKNEIDSLQSKVIGLTIDLIDEMKDHNASIIERQENIIEQQGQIDELQKQLIVSLEENNISQGEVTALQTNIIALQTNIVRYTAYLTGNYVSLDSVDLEKEIASFGSLVGDTITGKTLYEGLSIALGTLRREPGSDGFRDDEKSQNLQGEEFVKAFSPNVYESYKNIYSDNTTNCEGFSLTAFLTALHLGHDPLIVNFSRGEENGHQIFAIRLEDYRGDIDSHAHTISVGSTEYLLIEPQSLEPYRTQDNDVLSGVYRPNDDNGRIVSVAWTTSKESIEVQ